MPHAYTEDQVVEQPAIALFAELDWTTVPALEETFGATGPLQREPKGEVVLESRLRAASERLNPVRESRILMDSSIDSPCCGTHPAVHSKKVETRVSRSDLAPHASH